MIKLFTKKFWGCKSAREIADEHRDAAVKMANTFEPIKAELPQQETEPGLNADSPTWKFVVEYAVEEIDRLREANDKDLGENKTDQHRGAIRALKRLIDLPDKQVRDNRTKASRQGILADGMNDYDR